MAGAKRVVALMFGGASPEHEVSVVSARGVWEGFDRAAIDPMALAVDETGRWLGPELSRRILEDGRSRVRVGPDEDDGRRVVLAPGEGLILRHEDGTAAPLRPDAVFSVVHGRDGEDGRIQGALDVAGVPYVGSGVAGSAAAMDKALARAVVEAAGIELAASTRIDRVDWTDDRAAVARRVEREIGVPVFVKPANGGSSVGISRVDASDRLAEAIDHAFRYDRRVVVERAVDGREIEVAVIGNDRPEASVPGEVVPGARFYTYDDKYRDGRARLHIPADLSAERSDAVRRLAIDAYRALDLAGLARVDFLFERSSGRFLFNEANTLPGFTPISMYSKLWAATGVPYARLLERLVDLAVERFDRDQARRRSDGPE